MKRIVATGMLPMAAPPKPVPKPAPAPLRIIPLAVPMMTMRAPVPAPATPAPVPAPAPIKIYVPPAPMLSMRAPAPVAKTLPGLLPPGVPVPAPAPMPLVKPAAPLVKTAPVRMMKVPKGPGGAPKNPTACPPGQSMQMLDPFDPFGQFKCAPLSSAAVASSDGSGGGEGGAMPLPSGGTSAGAGDWSDAWSDAADADESAAPPLPIQSRGHLMRMQTIRQFVQLYLG